MSTHYWGPDAVDQVLITKPSVPLVDDSQADKSLNPFQSLQLPSQWSSLSVYQAMGRIFKLSLPSSELYISLIYLDVTTNYVSERIFWNEKFGLTIYHCGSYFCNFHNLTIEL